MGSFPSAAGSGSSPGYFSNPSGGGYTYYGPGANYGPITPTDPQPSLWNRLVGALGNMPQQPSRPGAGGGLGASMPGTTVGQPAGAANNMGPPPMPMLPQGQMATPRGIGPIFPAQPAAGGGSNPGLMAQYTALQQLMRGS